MGGKSTTTQSSTTEPWKPAQPALNGILGQLQTMIPNSGLSSTAQGAIDQMEGNAQGGNPFASQITGAVSGLLGGGGANNEAGNINGYYQQYADATKPLASNTDYNPYNTPGFSDAIKTATGDITNQINGQFAAAGRDFSGMNTQTLARGLTQGLAPTIAAQYNQNVNNQQGAAQNLFNAGNAKSGLLAGLTQQGVNNQVQGISSANDALSAQNYTPQMLLQLEQLKQQLPAQNLGLLTQIGVPIAGLGTQSQGTSTTTQPWSQTFAQVAGGLGSLFGGGKK